MPRRREWGIIHARRAISRCTGDEGAHAHPFSTLIIVPFKGKAAPSGRSDRVQPTPPTRSWVRAFGSSTVAACWKLLPPRIIRMFSSRAERENEGEGKPAELKGKPETDEESNTWKKRTREDRSWRARLILINVSPPVGSARANALPRPIRTPGSLSRPNGRSDSAAPELSTSLESTSLSLSLSVLSVHSQSNYRRRRADK